MVPEDTPDFGSGEMLDTLQGAAEEEDWEENNLKYLPHLEQLGSFVINSQALVNLRGNIRKLIDSRSTINNPLITEEPKFSTEQQSQEPPQPLNLKSAHSESADVQQNRQLSESASIAGCGSPETKMEVLNQKRFWWRRINEILKQFT